MPWQNQYIQWQPALLIAHTKSSRHIGNEDNLLSIFNN